MTQMCGINSQPRLRSGDGVAAAEVNRGLGVSFERLCRANRAILVTHDCYGNRHRFSNEALNFSPNGTRDAKALQSLLAPRVLLSASDYTTPV